MLLLRSETYVQYLQYHSTYKYKPLLHTKERSMYDYLYVPSIRIIMDTHEYLICNIILYTVLLRNS